MSKTAIIYPGKCQGNITIPPSKSLAHRAIICASLAKGISHITNISYSEDIKATLNCMKQLGAEIMEEKDTLIINGVGFRSAIEKNVNDGTIINCNESGSTLRFLIPIFALSDKHCIFTGAGRLMQRPQAVYKEIFESQNKKLLIKENQIEIFESINADIFEVQGNISSQFISGLLFALPMMEEDSMIKIIPPFESRSYVDLTLEMLEKFGIKTVWLNQNTLLIKGGQQYKAFDYRVEGDYSQLAFFGVLAAINDSLNIKGISHYSKQGDQQIIEILEKAGAKIQNINSGYKIMKANLQAQEIDLQNCPDLGPILTVLAAASKDTTKIKNAARLRIKESDRIAAMETELKKIDVNIVSDFNTVTIQGGWRQTQQTIFESHNDHRIVMSLAVLATVLDKPVTINQAEAINKSYPTFFDDLQKVGIKVEYN